MSGDSTDDARFARARAREHFRTLPGGKTGARAGPSPAARSATIRRLMLDPTVTLDRMWAELNKPPETSRPVLEALMYSLHTRGVPALGEPDTQRRLSQMSREQIREVGNRLMRPAPHWKPWSRDDAKVLALKWKELRNE